MSQLVCSICFGTSDFVRSQNGDFVIGSKPYHFVGTNFWYGLNLGSTGPGGDRHRLLRELDRLKKIGVTQVRILGGSEGPDTAPWRLSPTLQKAPGVYDSQLWEGLDFFLDELSKRNMYAVIMLTNFWTWSGGMAQYHQWVAKDKIPYPEEGFDWETYQQYASAFYEDKIAQGYLDDFIKTLITRKNSFSQKLYKDDPTIMAWELGNEPRYKGDIKVFLNWISREAQYIKSLDSNHLLTTGSEGEPPKAGLDLAAEHSYAEIDYVTIHLWVQNWGWYDPHDATTFPEAVVKMKDYLEKMSLITSTLGKPLVLEEFGLARDDEETSRNTKTTLRDIYYDKVFDQVYSRVAKKTFSGTNFWAWGGEGIPATPKLHWWEPGDSFTGEPPAERQGWYSVFDTDDSTLKVISNWASKISAL